ncbi:hypothetical protein W911_05975 [Hyphomicrobium nitrativorans NL23]|uniref:Uncharacterized protein n=2 Tax=Hyphomicrobium TaxID=81 RepID=V5SJ81_9HYPH|nr:hypothetical protein W911_05975 [Hyphomicrobium nitrativorans NL23]
MALTVIANHSDLETGLARLTYDALCEMTSLSRAKLSRGLDVLKDYALIEREPNGRSTYLIRNYDTKTGWAKFPAKGLYSNGVVTAFTSFRLRQRAELDAMKLFFLFASRRDRKSNMAKISYEKIEEYSGVTREHIKRALTILGANSLVHIEHVPSAISAEGVANAYRLVHLYSRLHMGTIRRGMDAYDFDGYGPAYVRND